MHYEIDLSQRHAQQLRSTLAPYVDSARLAEKAAEKACSTEKPARTSKQREREEQRNRQENRQLTEQIRGAAQRTRDRKKVAEQQTSGSEEDPAGERRFEPLVESLEKLGQQEKSERSAKTPSSSNVPAPQFSSAANQTRRTPLE